MATANCESTMCFCGQRGVGTRSMLTARGWCFSEEWRGWCCPSCQPATALRFGLVLNSRGARIITRPREKAS